jgi:hypothetical protein
MYVQFSYDHCWCETCFHGNIILHSSTRAIWLWYFLHASVHNFTPILHHLTIKSAVARNSIHLIKSDQGYGQGHVTANVTLRNKPYIFNQPTSCSSLKASSNIFGLVDAQDTTIWSRDVKQMLYNCKSWCDYVIINVHYCNTKSNYQK